MAIVAHYDYRKVKVSISDTFFTEKTEIRTQNFIIRKKKESTNNEHKSEARRETRRTSNTARV